jgi:hypothetical protein
MSGQQYFSFIPDENKLTAYQIFTAIQPGKVLITYTTALQQMQLYLKLCEREKNTTGMSGEQINETLVVMNNYGLL